MDGWYLVYDMYSIKDDVLSQVQLMDGKAGTCVKIKGLSVMLFPAVVGDGINNTQIHHANLNFLSN